MKLKLSVSLLLAFTSTSLFATVTMNCTSPTNASTSSSPVTVSCAPRATTGSITGTRIYVDSVDSKVYPTGSPFHVSVPVPAGTHTIVVRSWDTQNGYGDSGRLVVTVNSTSASGSLTEVGNTLATLNPDNVVSLIGIASAIASGVPPTPDQAHQDAVVTASIDSLVKNGLMEKDPGDDSNLSASKSFALNYVHMANGYSYLKFSSPLVQWANFVIAGNTKNGAVDWNGCLSDFNDIANFGVVEKWFTTGNASKQQLAAFMLDFAKAVYAYSH